MVRLTMAILALVLPLSALAKEPAFERWTPVTDKVQPDVIGNFAPMSVEVANDLLSTSKAALLYDRASGFDQMPEGGFVMRSRRRLMSREGYEFLPDADAGWVIWRNGMRDKDRLQVNQADHPPQRILGVPSDVTRVAWRRLSPFNHVAAQFDEEMFVAQYVSVRMRDPLDQMQSSYWAYVAVGATFRHEQVVEGELSTWLPVLTMGGRKAQEPRLVYVPIDAQGGLDTSRDGVMLRFSASTNNGADSWMMGANGGLVASAVRLHFGTEEELEARLSTMSSMPKERYAEPGSETDPLMLAPRTRRDPLGAGVEARQLVFGDITVVDLSGLHSNRPSLVGRWDGVDVAAWFGRGLVGLTARQDLIAGRLMVRLGSMRDTNYTALGVELGGHPLPNTAGQLTSVAVNGTMQTYRPMGRNVFGRPLEMGNRIRAGTTGVEYESSVGLRVYTKKGLVLTPSGMAGIRWSFREQRAFLTVGVAVEGSWNRNWFGKRAEAKDQPPAASE